MSKILIAWELGGGLGHLTPLVPIVARLCLSGHQVFAAVRDLSKVERIFSGQNVTFLQAPIKVSKAPNLGSEPRSFAHILYNNGFADRVELSGMAGAWRALYRLVKPDLIICDHAPIALLASRSIDLPHVIIGTGFCCPPDVYPLPDFRPWLPSAEQQLFRDEAVVLQNINSVLASWQLAPIGQVSHLYSAAARTFLTTYPELDHYAARGPAQYSGTWTTPGGRPPEWPQAAGKKVFAYLKHFETLPDLLQVMKQTGLPTLVYIDDMDAALRDRFETPALRFSVERLDMAAAGATCDLAILNGGHNATCLMLLAGKPIMTIPLSLEQAYNGSSVAKLEAGFGALPQHPEVFAPTLSDLLDTDKYLHGAQRFAAKYADLDVNRQIESISAELNGLL